MNVSLSDVHETSILGEYELLNRAARRWHVMRNLSLPRPWWGKVCVTRRDRLRPRHRNAIAWIRAVHSQGLAHVATDHRNAVPSQRTTMSAEC
jgi:hypothetical protein